MPYTVPELMSFLEENDVKFIRLAFCDLFGRQKNISILPSELPRAFASGISFDASAIAGFGQAVKSDLLLWPDAETLTFLPWRPSQGRVVRLFCEIREPAGEPFYGDCRALLRAAVAHAAARGFDCRVGPECEFYLFELDAAGRPTRTPQDTAGYMDIAPEDKGENVHREICLTLEEMAIAPESSHHEQGPGQNEIDFRYGPALTAADQFLSFRNVVKTVTARSGLYASFLPKPLPELPGSGLHINLSLFRNGENLFAPGPDGTFSAPAQHFLAGVLAHVAEITAFLNPLTNSYRRFGSFEAPKYLTWSSQNRSQLIRIPAATAERTRMELRSADPTANPYLAFALLLEAGLAGLARELPPAAPVDENLYTVDAGLLAGLATLPASLEEALTLAEESDFVRQHLAEPLRQSFLHAKRREAARINSAGNPEAAEHELYFAQY